MNLFTMIKLNYNLKKKEINYWLMIKLKHLNKLQKNQYFSLYYNLEIIIKDIVSKKKSLTLNQKELIKSLFKNYPKNIVHLVIYNFNL